MRCKTGKGKLIKGERRIKSLEYRKQGYTYREIGKILGASSRTIHQDITAALEELRKETLKETSELRALELSRLDDLIYGIYTEYSIEYNGKRFVKDLNAIDRLLKVYSERVKLIGVNAPEQIEIKTNKTWGLSLEEDVNETP